MSTRWHPTRPVAPDQLDLIDDRISTVERSLAELLLRQRHAVLPPVRKRRSTRWLDVRSSDPVVIASISPDEVQF